MNETYTMKEILEQCDITEDAVRYYEKIGLLPPVKRKPNGHRIYSAADKETLLSIKCFKKTGMTLDEIKLFLLVQNIGDHTMSPEVARQLREYQSKIEQQQLQLQQAWDMIEAKLHSGKRIGLHSG